MVLIGILVVASAITSTNYHSIVDNLLFGMTLLIPLAVLLLLYTHIQIDNGTLRYVNMLFQREAVDIGKIKRIHEGNNMLSFQGRIFITRGTARNGAYVSITAFRRLLCGCY